MPLRALTSPQNTVEVSVNLIEGGYGRVAEDLQHFVSGLLEGFELLLFGAMSYTPTGSPQSMAG